MPIKRFKTDDEAMKEVKKLRKQGKKAHVIGLKKVWKVKYSEKK
jgi:hypothetical protein